MDSAKAPLFLNQRFNSFKEFSEAKAKYEDQKFMIWTTGKSTTVQYANKLITSKGGTDVFAERLKYRYIKYSCKLGVLDGEEERIGTGKGDRPIQETNKIGCQAFLHVKAKGRSQLFVYKLIEEHNHECSKELYEMFPEKRQVISEDVQEKIKLLCDAKAKPSMIRIVLRGLTGNLTSRDLANFRAQLKKEKHEGRSEEDRLSKVLEDLLTDKDASLVVGRDKNQKMKFLFFQTSGMKRNVARYGKVILLDHSHKVNSNRMPVCVIMVMDGEGNGRAAGYAFVANEQLVTVAEVLKSFRESIGEELAVAVRTIVIDKDPSEIGAIEQVFPEVHIHLCIFHVGRSLNEKSSKESALVKEILDKLKYATTDSKFQSLCSELKEAASSKFYDYFKENWEHCPQAWSYRDKQKSINLGNTTTNRVENHNSKIKMASKQYYQYQYQALPVKS
ncbi:Zinc finger SWIM domain-containing protein 3 [Frankliniella fusca]|uniref:Zinc finger SWIM domain-containing protein 3 n=1 Tax=Frankliniella fusca TaxID=407009 RepID=A0AAE1H9E1_9NEOP|nr:Zinc finger SWIM domain-containing protein 3 [Frankliniella fusca]